MSERNKYLLCPQCGDRRFFVKASDGKEHFVYVLADQSIVYCKTGEPIPADLDTSVLWCAGCSWYGPVRKLTLHFEY